ncbi:phytolongin Phyl2.2-like [Lycium ferocissimum]|uniref:phytolongin Phyl2.2-like n=1 Tax=Lycium ferocissimum TaxID=112874 RepID=UPI0028169E14|nr:phytolongin Phyl2.2-like [Lycium ferocissimum]
MMITDPSLVHYACVAKGTIILAEINSKDADLGSLALKCLEKTPPLHTFFSHTIRNRTYVFLIENPFVFFAIFDEKIEKSDGLLFLRRVKDAFGEVIERSSGKKRLDKIHSHCFQGELNPVFHQLLDSSIDVDEGGNSPRSELDHNGRSASLDSMKGKKIGSMPLLADAANSLKLKKKRFFGHFKKRSEDIGGEKKVDVCGDGGMRLSREFSVVMQKNGGLVHHGEGGGGHHQKAKKVWKKQVWVVLSLDLIVCTILFIVWLCVCRGFKCIDA